MFEYIKFWIAKEFAELIVVFVIVGVIGGLFSICAVWSSISSRRHYRRYNEAIRKKKENETKRQT